MAFWRSTPGTFLLLLLIAAGVGLTAGLVQVHAVTHPARLGEPPVDFESLEMDVEQVSFQSADGLDLSGWLLWGDPSRRAILLCHNLGTSKSSMLNLMIRLHEAGFTTLTFDFRGHGGSEGSSSTLGLVEKRDVLGGLAFLNQQERLKGQRFGIYGVGMGAHAAVLAAADRTALKVLVLDGLYPDVGYSLTRRVFRGWSPGVKYFGFLPRSLFAVTTRSSIDSGRASDLLPRLIGRDLLLVSPAGDSMLAQEMQRMYERIPEQKDADGNLITLPVTHTGGLYGAELDRYHSRVTAFFQDRLN